VFAAEVEEPGRRGVEQVIADQPPAWAQNPNGFGQGLLPGDDVVRHGSRQHEAELVVLEGRGCGIGSLGYGPVADGRQGLPCVVTMSES